MLGIVVSTRNRVFGLDLLRAFAIFCVVHRHGKHLLYGTRLDGLANLPLPHGVDLFFVLSGFLIVLSVIKMTERPDMGRDTWRFYGKTALRILPNYYALLLVNLLVVHCGMIDAGAHPPLYRYITLTQNIATPFKGFYWESWSVPIQWWFYIFFPLFVLFVRRMAGRYAVAVVAVVAMAAAVVYRAIVCVGGRPVLLRHHCPQDVGLAERQHLRRCSCRLDKPCVSRLLAEEPLVGVGCRHWPFCGRAYGGLHLGRCLLDGDSSPLSSCFGDACFACPYLVETFRRQGCERRYGSESALVFYVYEQFDDGLRGRRPSSFLFACLWRGGLRPLLAAGGSGHLCAVL